jgi:hypothetical protein
MEVRNKRNLKQSGERHATWHSPEFELGGGKIGASGHGGESRALVPGQEAAHGCEDSLTQRWWPEME